MMSHISGAIERNTGTCLPTSLTEQHAANLCIAAVNRLSLGFSQRSRRPTQLKSATMLRVLKETSHANNANARTISFRKRKK
ncbi:hypothetical protein PHMEG_00028344 [Phytophthora megakarya]|uniref:Uncharacterized protein n=1 Tax=Phytophthora megakarya TaxID=4795 RepID=A0A225V674_9STRA|nr:hypothetical protein PHMEG_00028344 [Phytophthora megakarya]